MKRLRLTDKGLATIFGTGLVLFPIHFKYQPLKEYIFIPTIGLLLIIMSIVLLITRNRIKAEHLGSKWVWIPMLVIIGSLFARIAVEPSNLSIAGSCMGIVLFSTYLTARVLGVNALKPFLWATVVVSVSQIIASIVSHGDLEITGGLISNYCASAGFVILGFMTVQNKQWLVVLVGIGLFFTGALEAVFAVVVLGIIALFRRDFSRKLLLIVLIVAVIGGITFTTGFGQQLYQHASNNLKATASVVLGETDNYGGTRSAVGVALTNRWEVIVKAMRNIAPLGHGLNLTKNTNDTVHNVPLIIVDQLGIPAAIAWLVVSVYCLIKTKWKYLWSAVLVLSLFDHYVWTQFSPIWWGFVGVSTASVINSDLIFRKAK